MSDTIYVVPEKWRLDLFCNPPPTLCELDDEDELWQVCMVELFLEPQTGANNPHYGNPTGYTHSAETRAKQSAAKKGIEPIASFKGHTHSQETKDKMSKSRGKPVVVNGVRYRSAGVCAKALGLYTIQVSDRCRSDKDRWKNWIYEDLQGTIRS